MEFKVFNRQRLKIKIFDFVFLFFLLVIFLSFVPKPACFPAGSQVLLDDFSLCAIENIVVGQRVIGALGEINEVKGLHRTVVGQNDMIKINGKHVTTSHHPHVSDDLKFLVYDIDVIAEEVYGQSHIIYDGSQYVQRRLDGLNRGRLIQLQIGSKLKTFSFAEEVKSIESIQLDKGETLYNLVTGGSHTYSVNGFFVTGWPSEKDFNYDTWQSEDFYSRKE